MGSQLLLHRPTEPDNLWRCRSKLEDEAIKGIRQLSEDFGEISLNTTRKQNTLREW